MGALWISHRGCQANYLENTREAFQEAREEGFAALETDLRLCASGEIVLSHDLSPRRVFGETGAVQEMDLSRFRKLRGPRRERPLSFEEFAEEFADMAWVLDIKPESAPAVLDSLRRWSDTDSRRTHLREHTTFLLWKAPHSGLLRTWCPEARCYPATMACWRAGLSVLAGVPGLGGIRPGEVYSLPPRLRGKPLYRRDIVDAYHRKGARVLAFLPRTREELAEAVGAGCDEILTDLPKRSLGF